MRAVAKTQRRWGSDGFAYAKRGVVPVNQAGWSRRRDFDMEEAVGKSNENDERVEQLFGVNHVAWVHPVKDTSLSCKVDPERRVLWEQAVYTQTPDVRNDWSHKWSQGVPQKVENGKDPLTRWGNMEEYYYGMYPNSYEEDIFLFVNSPSALSTMSYSSRPVPRRLRMSAYDGNAVLPRHQLFPRYEGLNPGEYWKQRSNQTLYPHMVWEREKAREMERYGGEFALPTDDYQTVNGVMPFLSAVAFRKLKYDIHEPCVRRLNKATAGGKDELMEVMNNTLDDGLRSDCVQQLARTVMWRSIKPRGGPLRAEFQEVLDIHCGGKAAFESSIVSAAEALNGDGFVWVSYSTATKSIDISPAQFSDVYDPTNIPIAALVVDKDVWSIDYESQKEYAERFLKAFDYDYAYAAYCAAAGLPMPQPLVF